MGILRTVHLYSGTLRAAFPTEMVQKREYAPQKSPVQKPELITRRLKSVHTFAPPAFRKRDRREEKAPDINRTPGHDIRMTAPLYTKGALKVQEGRLYNPRRERRPRRSESGPGRKSALQTAFSVGKSCITEFNFVKSVYDFRSNLVPKLCNFY